MKKKVQKKNTKKAPKKRVVLKVRHAAVIVMVLAGGVLLPLLAVWRQVYISNASIVQKELSDSLSVLRRQTERMRLVVEGLSDTKRIETIGREKLNLDYPTADRIVIVTDREARRVKKNEDAEFVRILKNSLNGEKESK